MASVYIHIFPNGKKYVGMTNISLANRWSNGVGYKNQPKMWDAIQQYGWDSVEHVVFDGLDVGTAERLERFLIEQLNTVDNGYNALTRSSGTRDFEKLGELIRHYRLARGLSQEDLASKIGYSSRSNICVIEKENINIPFNRLVDIFDVLDIPIHELLI